MKEIIGSTDKLNLVTEVFNKCLFDVTPND